MKLTHLRDVAAVAEFGSLRAAARALGIAQPAITRSIQEIERELGIAIFERQANGAVLTQMGKAFLPRLLAAQNELRQAREEIEQLKGVATGHVAAALSTVAHLVLLPRVLGKFQERYPNIFIRIHEGLYPSIESDLKDSSIDFYVGPLSELPLSKDILVEKLFDNRRVVLGRKGHPLSKAKSVKDLTGAGWITTSVTSSSGAELGPLFEGYGLPPPRIEVQAPHALSMIMAAAYSDLLMMLPKQWLEVSFTRELLEPINIREELSAAPICIVRRAGLPLTPAAEHLCDLLRRAAGHYSASDSGKNANSR